MDNKTNDMVYIGELIGYKTRWNLFSNNTNAIVKIGGMTKKIPIDNRSVKFLQKEYPSGSKVNIGFNGIWHIISQTVTNDFKLYDDSAVPFFEQE
jgi:hypothetical protein